MEVPTEVYHPRETEKQSEYLLHGDRYASCVPVGETELQVKRILLDDAETEQSAVGTDCANTSNSI